jgi:hypothetical protein
MQVKYQIYVSLYRASKESALGRWSRLLERRKLQKVPKRTGTQLPETFVAS